MPAPGVRAPAAAVLLAAYYWLLFANPLASTASAADAQLQADIDASRALFEARQFDQALAPTERLVSQLPTQALYHDRLARILHELNRPGDEARAWERVMAVSPTPVDACPMIGEAYQAAGRDADALAAFEKCAALPPRNPDFLLYLGQLLLKTDRKAEARRAFEQGLEIDNTYPDLHLLLGIRQFDEQQLREARASFRKFLELAPSRRSEVEVWLQRTEHVK